MARSNPDSFAAAQESADNALAAVEEILKGYKPVFGDEKDIYLVSQIKLLFKMKEELLRKRIIMQGGEKLAKDIAFKSQALLALLTEHKNARGKSDN